MEQKYDRVLGVIYGFLAFTIWGFLPLYWKLLDQIPALEILAHRFFWAFILIAVLLTITKSWHKLKPVFSNKKQLCYISLCSVLLSFNWGTYIWGVNSGFVVETSLGYYINPLMVFFLAVTILKEKCSLWQYIAISLAAVGVLIMTIQYGRVPWIALVLAITFALYGLSKKLVDVEALTGLAVETAVIMPLALAYLIYRQVHGIGAIGTVSAPVTILLIGTGVVTATPLLCFANGAKKVELSTIGFLQYIAPTISLFLGVFVFREEFATLHFFSFCFIWAALIIYSVSIIGDLKPKDELAGRKV